MPTVFEAKKPTSSSKSHIPSSMGEGTTVGPLTSFSVRPNDIHFETQEAEEQVILFLRQHPIVNLPWIIIAVLMAITPTLLLPIFAAIVNLEINLPAGYFIVGTIFWYMATFGFVFANFLVWFFNIYIVTNERVVDIDFLYLLYKHFSQAELNKIQDISYSSGGIIAALFNYGNVIVETAGETPNLEFESVPYPEKVVETIRSLTENSGGNL